MTSGRQRQHIRYGIPFSRSGDRLDSSTVGTSGRQHFQYLDCTAMTLLTTRTVGSLAYSLHGSRGSGGSPIRTLTHAKADFAVDSRLYPPSHQPRNLRKGHTSRTRTSLPSARGISICVMCAYPAGVTSHSPMGSPAAASNPAETKLDAKINRM